MQREVRQGPFLFEELTLYQGKHTHKEKISTLFSKSYGKSDKYIKEKGTEAREEQAGVAPWNEGTVKWH